VLVADDNADMRGYLLRLLSPHYDVRAVADGRQALDAALAEPPDLVVSDVMMPELDGMGLLAALRAEPRTARVPVVLLSARAGEEAAVEGLAAGADDYLVKPFSAQELLARVGAHLELGRTRRAAEEQFTAMADLAPALIWVADPDGRRVFVNRGWTEFTGRPAREEVGDGWERGLHPADRDRYSDVVAAATARREGWEVDVRLRRADGTYHWLLERVAPIGVGETFAATWAAAPTSTPAPARQRGRRCWPRWAPRWTGRPPSTGSWVRWPACSSTSGWPTCAACGCWGTTAGCASPASRAWTRPARPRWPPSTRTAG